MSPGKGSAWCKFYSLMIQMILSKTGIMNFSIVCFLFFNTLIHNFGSWKLAYTENYWKTLLTTALAMVTYSDPTFAMIRSRIENIEEIQRKIFKCLHESEAQLRQVNYVFLAVQYTKTWFETFSSCFIAALYNIHWKFVSQIGLLYADKDALSDTCTLIHQQSMYIILQLNIILHSLTNFHFFASR